MAFWDKFGKGQEVAEEDYDIPVTPIQPEINVENEEIKTEVKSEMEVEPISINPMEVSSESLLSNLTIKGTNLRIETKDSLYLSNCIVEGDISTEQNVTLDGGIIKGSIAGNSVVLQNNANIEGNINKSGVVTIENGRVNGEVIADEVIVNSYVKGSIRAKIVELKATAIIDGDVFTEDLAVDRGATVSGNIKVTIPKAKKDVAKENEKQQKKDVPKPASQVEENSSINLDKDLVN